MQLTVEHPLYSIIARIYDSADRLTQALKNSLKAKYVVLDCRTSLTII
jgi:hypothetical protein